jgi:hypothetical protein
LNAREQGSMKVGAGSKPNLLVCHVVGLPRFKDLVTSHSGLAELRT